MMITMAIIINALTLNFITAKHDIRKKDGNST